MTLAGDAVDLQWVVEVLNGRGDETDRLRELVNGLNKISYGSIDRAIAGKVNAVFRDICWSPLLQEKNGKLSVTWLPREGDTIYAHYAGTIANLAAVGLLVRVHQCGRCGHWFASKRERHPYAFERPCSVNCRIALHRKKPEAREKRNAYQRGYYHETVGKPLKQKASALKRHGNRTK